MFPAYPDAQRERPSEFGGTCPPFQCLILGWPLKPFEKYLYIGSPIKAIRENIKYPRFLPRIVFAACLGAPAGSTPRAQPFDAHGPRKRCEVVYVFSFGLVVFVDFRVDNCLKDGVMLDSWNDVTGMC